jgi:hypothetical protein
MAANKILTIAIPTCNRPDKLKRIVTRINDEVTKFELEGDVGVLISDNSDIRSEESFNHLSMCVKYHWNEENIGFDKNLIQCVSHSTTKYVWLFGDDDIIEHGVLPTILEYLRTHSPELVVLKFRQFNGVHIFCAGTEQTQFIESVDYDEIVKTILLTGKLTSFLLNKSLAISNMKSLERFVGTGWMHQILAAESMLNSAEARMHYLRKDCAYSIEEEVKALEWTPLAFRMGSQVVEHPFFSCFNGLESRYIKEYSSNLIKQELILLLYGLSGYWKVKDLSAYKYYLKTIKYSYYEKLPLRYVILYFSLRLRIYKIFLPVLFVMNKFKRSSNAT